MKKVLLTFVVATMFAACSDSSTKTDSTITDSTGVKKDSSVVAPVIKPDTTNKMSADTSKTKDTTLRVKIKK